jgi:predicted transcriptional regulator
VERYHCVVVTRVLQLHDDVDAALQREAAASGKSVNDVVNDGVRAYQERKEYLAALDEGIAEADRGDVVGADEVFAAVRANLEGMRATK